MVIYMYMYSNVNFDLPDFNMQLHVFAVLMGFNFTYLKLNTILRDNLCYFLVALAVCMISASFVHVHHLFAAFSVLFVIVV